MTTSHGNLRKWKKKVPLNYAVKQQKGLCSRAKRCLCNVAPAVRTLLCDPRAVFPCPHCRRTCGCLTRCTHGTAVRCYGLNTVSGATRGNFRSTNSVHTTWLSCGL